MNDMTHFVMTVFFATTLAMGVHFSAVDRPARTHISQGLVSQSLPTVCEESAADGHCAHYRILEPLVIEAQ